MGIADLQGSGFLLRRNGRTKTARGWRGVDRKACYWRIGERSTMVWRYDAMSMGCEPFERWVFRGSGGGDCCGHGRLQRGNGDARFNHFASCDERCCRVAPDLWSSEPIRCYGPELDHG